MAPSAVDQFSTTSGGGERPKVLSQREKRPLPSANHKNRLVQYKVIAAPNGPLGLMLSFEQGRGATIKTIYPLGPLADVLEEGDRIVSNNGRIVCAIDDIIRGGRDGQRLFGIIPKSSNGPAFSIRKQGDNFLLCERKKSRGDETTFPARDASRSNRKKTHHPGTPKDDVNDNLDPDTFPDFQVMKNEWGTYSFQRKCVIAMKNHYWSIQNFEMTALGLNVSSHNCRVPWEIFSPDNTYPDIGLYLIKYPYLNGIFLISIGVSGLSLPKTVNGLRQRLKSGHLNHGRAFDVASIAGDMRGYLNKFEDLIKSHAINLRPKSGVNGTETFEFQDEKSADRFAERIIDYSQQFLKYSNLEIDKFYDVPGSDKVRLDANIGKPPRVEEFEALLQDEEDEQSNAEEEQQEELDQQGEQQSDEKPEPKSIAERVHKRREDLTVNGSQNEEELEEFIWNELSEEEKAKRRSHGMSPCFCGKTHLVFHYERECGKCQRSYQLDRHCIGYYPKNFRTVFQTDESLMCWDCVGPNEPTYGQIAPNSIMAA